MATISENQLSVWTKPAFDNEDAKRENTEKLIREAIRQHPFLKTIAGDIRVYAKGSYKNNTNVRRDSDVDVAVEYTAAVHTEHGPNTSRDEVRRVLGTSAYSGPLLSAAGGFDIPRFKRAIEEAMISAFGQRAVTRSNKVITVREGTRSLAADLVPCQTYRKYWSPQRFNQGIRLLPDRYPGHLITNYPEQHYRKGVAKNEATWRRFKSVVRILKNLENQMVKDGAIKEVPSYLIECLAFNAPDESYDETTWGARLRRVLFYIWDDAAKDGYDKRWMEVNDIKYLFHVHQKWTVDDAREFSRAAWQYVEKP